MIKHIRIGGMVLSVIAVLAVALAFPTFAGALESASLSVTPSKIELQLEPGATTTFTIDVSNTATATMALNITAWDFARDEKGKVRQVKAADADAFHGCSQWVVLPFSRTQFIGENAKKTLDFEVRVPKGTETNQSRFCYLQIKGSVLSTEGQSPGADEIAVMPTVSYSMNALLLVQVGKPTDQGNVIYRDAVTVRALNVDRFNFKPEVALNTAIYNKGNVHANLAQGSGLQIWQGDALKATIPFKEYTLLPDNVVAVPTVWHPNAVFGRYTARFVGDVGLDQPITAQKTFYVIKPWFLGAALASTVVFVILMILFFKRFRIQLRPRSDGSA